MANGPVGDLHPVVGPVLVGPTSAMLGFHHAASITFPHRDGEPTGCHEPGDAAFGGSAPTLIPGPSSSSTLARWACPAPVPLLMGVSGGFGQGNTDLGGRLSRASEAAGSTHVGLWDWVDHQGPCTEVSRTRGTTGGHHRPCMVVCRTGGSMGGHHRPCMVISRTGGTTGGWQDPCMVVCRTEGSMGGHHHPCMVVCRTGGTTEGWQGPCMVVCRTGRITGGHHRPCMVVCRTGGTMGGWQSPCMVVL